MTVRHYPWLIPSAYGACLEVFPMKAINPWVGCYNSGGTLEGGCLKIKVVVHEAEEGGYWAEVPAIPGCATQGETMEELMANVREAIEGCLETSPV